MATFPLKTSCMLTYHASYTTDADVIVGTVLDFTGTVAYGESLDDARRNLASALRDMAETNLLMGEPLPIPNPDVSDENAELEEPIYLVLETGHQLTTTVAATDP